MSNNLENKSLYYGSDSLEIPIDKSKMLRANYKLYKTPLCITPQIVKIDFEDLFDLILEKYCWNKN